MHLSVRVEHLRGAEVYHLECVALGFDQQVLWLQVSMHDLVIVAVHYSGQQLEGYLLKLLAS